MPENTPNEGFKAPEVSEKQRADQEKLLKLKEGVEHGQFDKVVDSLMKEAVSKKDIPTAKLDAFVTSLNSVQSAAFQKFLEGTPQDPRKAALLEKMRDLKAQTPPASKNITGPNVETISGLSEPAQKVIAALDKGIARLTSSGKLSEIAAKIGFKGEIGPQQLDFVKNFFLGYAAKVFEGVTASLRKVNPTADMSKILNLPLELRLLNIKDPIQKEKYRKAYLKRAKEMNGVFVAPTLEEALNPQVAAPEAKPTEAAPSVAATGEKVADAKRTVKLTDGTNFDMQRSDKKTVVSAGGNKAEVKVAGGDTLDVFALDAKDGNKATVTLKLIDNRTVSVDAKTLRNAVQKKEKGLSAADGTKIELLEINNV